MEPETISTPTPQVTEVTEVTKKPISPLLALITVVVLAILGILTLVIVNNNKNQTTTPSITPAPTSAFTKFTPTSSTPITQTKVEATLVPNESGTSSDMATQHFSATISNLKVSPTYKVLIAGDLIEDKALVEMGNGISMWVETSGDVQTLKFAGEGNNGFLSISLATEWEQALSYSSAVLINGSKTPNLGRVDYIEYDRIWRYFDDQSTTNCNSQGGPMGSTPVPSPCGSGFILKGGTTIVQAFCYSNDPTACDNIMRTITFTKVSD